MPSRLGDFASEMTGRFLAGDSEFGVHIEYEALYRTFVFLVAIYISGQLATRMKMPSLVGEIVAGILLGPPLGDFVPNPEAWVLLGETGLVLLVAEAGIDIDVSTLSLIGTRGLMIAILGSILPILFGFGVALLVNEGGDMTAAIAAGCCFGPTSLGIALNILKGGGVLNTPVGQLIISAAVIDDMIALILLSQLESLSGTITVTGILIPVISALGFLIVGGYVALYILPGFIESFILVHTKPQNKGKIELGILFGILLFMMPATYYAKASYLMGAFVAGLAFCTSHELHHTFVGQFKRLMQWLMRVFFAASIGFQVPILDMTTFRVVWKGVAFTLALLGKLAVGFMVPNFGQVHRYTGNHLRDCLITGFSMAAEGEFAFVIAVFAVDSGLIPKDLYASIVLAVLLSTIIPPFMLRFTITYYNKSAQEELRRLRTEDKENQFETDSQESPEDAKKNGRPVFAMSEEQRVEKLVGDIQESRALFYRIQTQAEARWGLLHSIMASVAKMGVEMIDHRSWHTRGIRSTLVNEMYVRDTIDGSMLEEERMAEVKKALERTIDQPMSARVRIQRWYPGVVDEIEDSIHGFSERPVKQTSENVEKRLLEEATQSLDYRVKLNVPKGKKKKEENMWGGVAFGYDAEINVEGETFRVDISHETLEALRDGYAGELDMGGGGHHGDQDNEPATPDDEVQSNASFNSTASSSNWHVKRQLRGYVRSTGRPGRPRVGPVVADQSRYELDLESKV